MPDHAHPAGEALYQRLLRRKTRHTRRHIAPRMDRGQATPLVALLFAVTAGAIVLLGHLGAVVADRAEARTAADAAALAGAAEGEPAARAVASANDADLEEFVALGGDVEVVVRVGQARARARARGRWVATP